MCAPPIPVSVPRAEHALTAQLTETLRLRQFSAVGVGLVGDTGNGDLHFDDSFELTLRRRSRPAGGSACN